MNKDNAKDYLPLVQALADGKTIQESLGTRWDDMTSVMFTRDPQDYRIKPEPRKPREWTVEVSTEANSYHKPGFICLPVAGSPPNDTYWETIRVREITEE